MTEKNEVEDFLKNCESGLDDENLDNEIISNDGLKKFINDDNTKFYSNQFTGQAKSSITMVNKDMKPYMMSETKYTIDSLKDSDSPNLTLLEDELTQYQKQVESLNIKSKKVILLNKAIISQNLIDIDMFKSKTDNKKPLIVTSQILKHNSKLYVIDIKEKVYTKTQHLESKIKKLKDKIKRLKDSDSDIGILPIMLQDIRSSRDKPLVYRQDGINILNNYPPPTYLQKEYFSGVPRILTADEEKRFATPPFLFIRLLSNIVGSCPDANIGTSFDENIQYLLDWIYTMIRSDSRNIIILAIVDSLGGVGKGFLYDFLSYLVGEANTITIVQKDLKSNYNGHLVNKTFSLLNEIDLESEKGIDLIKTLTDHKIPIREMYKDTYMLDNPSNTMFFTNRYQSLRLEPSDRRFTVLPSGSTVLQDVMSQDEMKQLSKPNKALLEHLYYYLTRYHIIKSDMSRPLDNKTRRDAIEMALPEWQDHLINEVFPQNKGIDISFKDLNSIIKLRFDHRIKGASWAEFLKQNRNIISTAKSNIRGFHILDHTKTEVQ